MFLTVGIAVYNIKEKFLRECIESVTANIGDFEIIIVDDCSDNGADRICEEYAGRDGRVRYIRNEKNTGVGAVRNKIIDEARGKWLTFVDGDDAVSDRLCAELFELCDSDFDVIRFERAVFKENLPHAKGRGTLTPLDKKTVFDIGVSAAVRHRLYDGAAASLNVSPGLVTTAMYRREFLVKNKCRFDTELKAAEDSLFTTGLCAVFPRTAILSQPLYYYRNNPDSVTNKYDENSRAVTDAYLEKIRRFIGEKLSGDKKITEYFYRYRCNLAVIDNFERNIFHRDNKKPIRERKREFLKLVSEKPYIDGLKYAGECEVKKNRLVLTLAVKKRFFAINFAYRCSFIFRLYGGIYRRMEERLWKNR